MKSKRIRASLRWARTTCYGMLSRSETKDATLSVAVLDVSDRAALIKQVANEIFGKRFLSDGGEGAATAVLRSLGLIK